MLVARVLPRRRRLAALCASDARILHFPRLGWFVLAEIRPFQDDAFLDFAWRQAQEAGCGSRRLFGCQRMRLLTGVSFRAVLRHSVVPGP